MLSSVRITERRFHNALGYAFRGTPRHSMKEGTQFLEMANRYPPKVGRFHSH